MNFGSPSVYQGGISVLTFTTTYNGSATGVAYTDDLAPLGMQIVQCPGAIGSTCTVGPGTEFLSGTAIGGTPGSTLIGVQDVSFNNASGYCVSSVCVSAATIGTQVNTTTAITSTSGFTGSAATASIDVLPDQPPTLSQEFSSDTVAQFGTVFLTLTIRDPNFGAPLYGIALTDTLPAGLKVGQNSGPSCAIGTGDITPSGTFTATPGSSTISISDLQLSSQCSFIVEITGEQLGVQTNMTGAITSTNGGTGETSTASVTVFDQVFKNGFE
jgi:hypothetical protein